MTREPEGWRRPHGLECRFDLYGLPYELSTQPKEKNEIWLSGYNNNFVRRVYVRVRFLSTSI